MARATYDLVITRIGGIDPTNWDETSIGALCNRATAIIDGYTYPQTISNSDDAAVEIEIDVVLRLIIQGNRIQSNDEKASEMVILTDEIKQRIDMLLGNNVAGTMDLIEEDDGI